MADTTNADGTTGGMDVAGRLSQIGNRTTLMVIDATLRALPKDGHGFADAATEMRSLARRMTQAARDFDATLAFDPDLRATVAG